MLRVDKIYVKKEEGSRLNFSRVQEIAEKKLQQAASSTKFRATQDGVKLEIIIGKPISLQTANKIFKIFSEERIKIKKVVWETEQIGVFETGKLEVTVS